MVTMGSVFCPLKFNAGQCCINYNVVRACVPYMVTGHEEHSSI